MPLREPTPLVFLERHIIGSQHIGTAQIGSTLLKPNAAQGAIGSPPTFRVGSLNAGTLHAASGHLGSLSRIGRVGSMRVGSARIGTFRAGSANIGTLFARILRTGTVLQSQSISLQTVGTLLVRTHGSFINFAAGSAHIGSARVGTLRIGRGVGSFGSLHGQRVNAGTLTTRNIASALALRVGSARTALLTVGSLTLRGNAGTFITRNVASALALRVGSARVSTLRGGTLRAGSGGFRTPGQTVIGTLFTSSQGSLKSITAGSSRISQLTIGSLTLRGNAGTFIARNIASALALRAGSGRVTGLLTMGSSSSGSHFTRKANEGTLTVRSRGSMLSARVGSLRAAAATIGSLTLRDTLGTLGVRNIASALAVKAGSLRAVKAGIGTTGLTIAGPTTGGTVTFRNIASALMMRLGSLRAGSARIGSLGAARGFFGSLHAGTIGKVSRLHVGTLQELGGYAGGSFVGSRAMKRAQLGSEHIRSRGIGTEKIADLRVGSLATLGTMGIGSLFSTVFTGAPSRRPTVADMKFTPDSKQLWLLCGTQNGQTAALYKIGTTDGRVVGSIVGTFLGRYGRAMALDSAGKAFFIGIAGSGGGRYGTFRVRKVGTTTLNTITNGSLLISGGALTSLRGMGADVDAKGSLWVGLGAGSALLVKFGTRTFNKVLTINLTGTVSTFNDIHKIAITKEGRMWVFGNGYQLRQVGTGDGRMIGSSGLVSGDTSRTCFAIPFDSPLIWVMPKTTGSYGTFKSHRAFGPYVSFSPAFAAGQRPMVNITPIGRNVAQGIATIPVAGSFRLVERFSADGPIPLGIRWHAWAKLST